MGRWIWTVAAMIQMMQLSVLVKRKLNIKAKLSIQKFTTSLPSPIIVNSRGCLKECDLRYKQQKYAFYKRWLALPYRQREKFSHPRWAQIELLLLCIEISHLRQFGHLTKGLLDTSFVRFLCPTGLRPREDPGHAGGIKSFSQPGNISAFQLINAVCSTDKMEEMGIGKSGLLCSEADPQPEPGIGWNRNRKWMD